MTVFKKYFLTPALLGLFLYSPLNAVSTAEKELIIAINNNSFEDVKQVSKFIQNINKPIKGFTPLQLACWRGFFTIVHFLVEKKHAVIDVKTKTFPWTPYDLARLFGYVKIAHYLSLKNKPLSLLKQMVPYEKQ